MKWSVKIVPGHITASPYATLWYHFAVVLADKRRDYLPLWQGSVDARERARDGHERQTAGHHDAASRAHPVAQVAVLRQRARYTVHLPGGRHVRRFTATLRP